MGHAFTRILIHCVFSTKYRRPWLSAEISGRLDAYLSGVAREHGLHLLRAGGIADHRHLLFDLQPSVSVSDAVRAMKANSSRWLKQTFPDCRAFEWQRGYSAFAVSYSARESVVTYIDAQAEHHRKLTFDEELRLLLSKHDIEMPKSSQAAADE